MIITCGRCTKDAGNVVKHDTVAEVRSCYAASQSQFQDWQDAEHEAEARAEAWAEGAWLRHAEAGVDDGFDEWERSRGVIDYATARDLAAQA